MPASLNISDLLNSGESETVEFKTSFGREAVETIVAFANTKGGTLLAGVKDDGRVCGITTGKETLNQWLEQIKSKTSPAIIPDITAHEISERTVVAIQLSKIEKFIETVNDCGRFNLDMEPLQALQKLKLITDGKSPVWASLMLFARNPMRHHIHIGRFKTPVTIIDDRQLSITTSQQTYRRSLLSD